ncbi:MAG: alpha-galactosidase, partial [Alkalispirochaeta sp.]
MITIASDSPLGGPLITITTGAYSYALGVFDGRFLVHLYWGAPLSAPPDPTTLIAPRRVDYVPVISPLDPPGLAGSWPAAGGGYALDTLPQEYPVWGTGDLRAGACEVRLGDGTGASRLEYREHEVEDGAVQPDELGIIHGDAAGPCRTLRVRLADPRGDYAVDLFYVVAENLPGLIRWARFTNTGQDTIEVNDPASAVVDLDGAGREVVTLHGGWARERHPVRRGVEPGRFETGSRNGASGHQSSPFIAVADAGTTETVGCVRAIALGYSGNFFARCDGDQFGGCRTAIGVGAFRGVLEPGEPFDTPEALLVYSDAGFSGTSARFHEVIRRGVVAPRWRRDARRVVINSWEAMYFDVDADRIVDLARQGREVGAELLVLDDGWFSRRRDDTTSLGDWWYNSERFPDGIGAVGEAVRREGLEFGLWIEPEMVSRESELYRSHPDWVIGVPGRAGTEARKQLVLDLANPAVVDHLYSTISAVLTEARPVYVKWDMNRNITEAGSPTLPPRRQGEMMHRYILGLYRLLQRLTEDFPDVLFEGCAGGGGRMDLGLARFSPRFWTSDQTDAVERLPIQYGTSLVFPPEMMGAHVSTVPNHQVGRVTPAWTRVVTALAFSFGFELDPAREPVADLAVFRQASEIYRRHRETFRTGRFVRIRGPLAGGAPVGAGGAWMSHGAGGSWMSSGTGATGCIGGTAGDYAWMIVSDDGREIFVFFVRPLGRGVLPPGRLPLPGLVRAVQEARLSRQEARRPGQEAGRAAARGPVARRALGAAGGAAEGAGEVLAKHEETGTADGATDDAADRLGPLNGTWSVTPSPRLFRDDTDGTVYDTVFLETVG